jgi:hypothetical protein
VTTPIHPLARRLGGPSLSYERARSMRSHKRHSRNLRGRRSPLSTQRLPRLEVLATSGSAGVVRQGETRRSCYQTTQPIDCADVRAIGGRATWLKELDPDDASLNGARERCAAVTSGPVWVVVLSSTVPPRVSSTSSTFTVSPPPKHQPRTP